MKKVLKILALTLAAVLMCISLGGCQMLDDARAAHAIWVDDTHIKLGDTEYILLPSCDYLQPISSGYEYVHVTDSDVPVLLSSLLGDSFDKSDDGIFLSSADLYDSNGAILYYCRSDKYDQISQLINNGFVTTGYCYSYYDYKNDTLQYYKLTENQSSVVDYVLYSAESSILPSVANLEYEYIVNLEFFSEDIQFRKEAFDICVLQGVYYIIKYDNESTILYRVPDNIISTFESIMSSAIASEKYFDQYLYDEEIEYEDELYY